ncbi:MAG TPA: lamin tail domain-containing protein [Saprospiraceae bacterium]|nr:lamin tail domain-containing protein [Saprospiraceae bacterium]
MKRTFLQTIISLFIMLVISGNLESQVVINEISYNPPETNTDSLEFLEIFNAGNAMVNIGGWYFLEGIEDTFPDIDLQPGDYYVIAFNAQAMLNVYGIVVDEWESGALSNGGELISLADALGNVVDSVRFDDSDPWPTEPDGNGPTLELIDSALDNNDGANWQFSGAGTGVIINGFEVSGTPGAENSSGGTQGPDLIIELANFAFNPNVAVIEVGSVIRWVNNEGHAHNVNGQQSAFPGNPESFFSGAPASGPWQYEFMFLIPGTYQYKCDPHAAQGMTGTIYVYDPNIYNDFTLEQLRLVNSNGSALFDGVPTTITGVVHGVNFQPDAYSFYIIDANNVGINVFSFDAGTYVVTEGDELRVSGVIDQFNGLLEIIPDTIELISSGNVLNTPRQVTALTEEDESSYVWLDELLIDSVSNISAGGFTIYTTHDLGSKIQVRVDVDANTGTTPEDFPQGGWLYVWAGIGTQFDNNSPFTSGYQVLALDLDLFVDGIQLVEKDRIAMQPNPAIDAVHFQSDLTINQIEIYSIEGKQLLRKQINGANSEVDIHLLPAGIHMVKAVTDQGIWTSLISIVK